MKGNENSKKKKLKSKLGKGLNGTHSRSAKIGENIGRPKKCLFANCKTASCLVGRVKKYGRLAAGPSQNLVPHASQSSIFVTRGGTLDSTVFRELSFERLKKGKSCGPLVQARRWHEHARSHEKLAGEISSPPTKLNHTTHRPITRFPPSRGVYDTPPHGASQAFGFSAIRSS
jgi:hypothetical protein